MLALSLGVQMNAKALALLRIVIDQKTCQSFLPPVLPCSP